MLYVDTREKGSLPIKIIDELKDVKRETLDAGDYCIFTNDKPVLIERKKYDDFVQSIMSGRLDEQLEKCKQVTDNIILLLEGTGTKYSKMSYKSYVAKIASISLKGIQIVNLRNSSESFVFIKKLHDMLSGDDGPSEIIRVKKKTKSLVEEAKYMLMGCSGIGPKTADQILAEHSIVSFGMQRILDVPIGKWASHLWNVLHATNQ